MIETAFPGLNPVQINAIERGSAQLDHCMTCQLSSNAYKHYMRSEGQSSSEAKMQAQEYIAAQEKAAQAAPGASAPLAGMISVDFLTLFAGAAHTVMDSTSPAHVDPSGDPLVWQLTVDALDGLGIPMIDFAGIIAHSEAEAEPTDEQFALGVAALQAAFAETYGGDAESEATSPKMLLPKGNGCTAQTCSDASISNGLLPR